MEITLENKTYSLEPIEDKNLVSGEIYLYFDKRGGEFTYDIRTDRFLNEDSEGNKTLESVRDGIDLYDYELEKCKAVELGIDKLEKFQYYNIDDSRNNTENCDKYFKIKSEK